MCGLPRHCFIHIDSLGDSLENKEEEMPVVRENKLSRIRRNVGGADGKV